MQLLVIKFKMKIFLVEIMKFLSIAVEISIL